MESKGIIAFEREEDRNFSFDTPPISPLLNPRTAITDIKRQLISSDNPYQLTIDIRKLNLRINHLIIIKYDKL